MMAPGNMMCTCNRYNSNIVVLLKTTTLTGVKKSWTTSLATTTNVLVQSVPITTKVVSSNPVHGDCLLDTTLCDKVCQ
jgi:hypothetical protein